MPQVPALPGMSQKGYKLDHGAQCNPSLPRFSRRSGGAVKAQHLSFKSRARCWVNFLNTGVMGGDNMVVAVGKLADPVVRGNHIREVERYGEWNAALIFLIIM